MMALVYSPEYLEHKTSNHPESPDRLIKIIEGLDEADLTEHVPFFKPGMAKEEDLEPLRALLFTLRKSTKNNNMVVLDSISPSTLFEVCFDPFITDTRPTKSKKSRTNGEVIPLKR